MEEQIIRALLALCQERWGEAADRDDNVRRPGEPAGTEVEFWDLRLKRAEALVRRVQEDSGRLSSCSDGELDLLWELTELAVGLAASSRNLFQEVTGKEWVPRR